VCRGLVGRRPHAKAMLTAGGSDGLPAASVVREVSMLVH